jgi:hypothetical protein
MLMIKDKKLSDIQQAGAGLKQPCAQWGRKFLGRWLEVISLTDNRGYKDSW